MRQKVQSGLFLITFATHNYFFTIVDTTLIARKNKEQTILGALGGVQTMFLQCFIATQTYTA